MQEKYIKYLVPEVLENLKSTLNIDGIINNMQDIMQFDLNTVWSV